MSSLILIQAGLALALAVDAAFRLLRVNSRTAAPIRHAFALLFTASLSMAGATLAGAVSAAWPTVILLAAVLAVQLSTARYWRRHVPSAFQEAS